MVHGTLQPRYLAAPATPLATPQAEQQPTRTITIALRVHRPPGIGEVRSLMAALARIAALPDSSSPLWQAIISRHSSPTTVSSEATQYLAAWRCKQNEHQHVPAASLQPTGS